MFNEYCICVSHSRSAGLNWILYIFYCFLSSCPLTCSVPPVSFCILIFVFFFSRFSATVLWWHYNFIIRPTFLLDSLCLYLNKWIYIFEYDSSRSLSHTFNYMLWKKHIWMRLWVSQIPAVGFAGVALGKDDASPIAVLRGHAVTLVLDPYVSSSNRVHRAL